MLAVSIVPGWAGCGSLTTELGSARHKAMESPAVPGDGGGGKTMADSKPSSPNNAIPSAEELRMQMLEREMAEMEKEQKANRLKAHEHEELAKAFLSEHVTEAERAKIQRLVRAAVEQGKTEALVYSFSSDLCSDGGRAINNAVPDWPDTLQGKARQLYDRYRIRLSRAATSSRR